MNYSAKTLILTFATLLGMSTYAMHRGHKVAVLAWGSLVEHSGDIALVERTGFKEHGQTGPELYIDYARKSQDGRLTLVIAPGLNANKMKTYYATYNGTHLDGALSALKVREGTTSENIGYVNLTRKTYRRKDFNSTDKSTSVKRGSFSDSYFKNNAQLQRIVSWAKSKGYTAVIWTDLPPTFTKTQFTAQTLKKHLNSLSPAALRKAYCYFKITPEPIRNSTRFGNDLMNHAAGRLGNIQDLTIAQCRREIFG